MINPLRRCGDRPIITPLWVISRYLASNMHVNMIASSRHPKLSQNVSVVRRVYLCVSLVELSASFSFPVSPLSLSRLCRWLVVYKGGKQMCCQGWQIRQHIPSVLFLSSILLSLAFVFCGEIARRSLGTPWAEASLPRCRFGQFAAARGKRASTTECRMIVISYLSEAVLHLLRWFSFQSPSLRCSPWDVFLLRTGTQSVKLTAHGERLESGEIIGRRERWGK